MIALPSSDEETLAIRDHSLRLQRVTAILYIQGRVHTRYVLVMRYPRFIVKGVSPQ